MKLADRIVALGVGCKTENGDFPFNNEYCIASSFFRADQFESDWRVAGALMEKVLDRARDRNKAWDEINPQGNWNSFMVQPKSLPRAINEACVEALEADK
jgi:hypothetical protein